MLAQIMAIYWHIHIVLHLYFRERCRNGSPKSFTIISEAIFQRTLKEHSIKMYIMKVVEKLQKLFIKMSQNVKCC